MKKLERILKVSASVALFCLIAVPTFATILTITYTNEQPNTTIRSSRWNQDMGDIQNFLNGNNLDSTDNIKAGGISTAALADGAVTDVKISGITTAGKVSGAALTGLSGTPSGAGVLPVANLGSGSPSASTVLVGNGIFETIPVAAFPTGVSIQTVNTQDASFQTTSTTGVTKDGVMTTSNGGQFMSASITPVSATDMLIVTIVANVEENTNTAGLGIVGLFEDSVTAALAQATFDATALGGANGLLTVPLIYEIPTYTTSAKTFKVRAAVDTGQCDFNGYNGGRAGGGVGYSSMTIQEIKQ